MDTKVIDNIRVQVERLRTLSGEVTPVAPNLSPILPRKVIPRGPRVMGQIRVNISLSHEARERRSAAQKARWAKYHTAKEAKFQESIAEIKATKTNIRW